MTEKFSIGTDLGGSYLNSTVGGFFALQLAARATYQIIPSTSVNLTAGLQNWTSEAGTLPMVGGGACYHFIDPLFSHLQSVRLGLQYIAKSDFPTWQTFVGVEFSLGSSRKSVEPAPITNPQPVPSPVPSPIPSMVAAPKNFTITLPSTHLSFETAKAIIRPKAKSYLEAIAKAFAENSAVWTHLSISGHTDSSGHAERNVGLSQRRAQAVALVFEGAGIDAERLKVRGAGSSEPVATNDTEDGMSKNRRVEILVDADPANAKGLADRISEINNSFNNDANTGGESP